MGLGHRPPGPDGGERPAQDGNFTEYIQATSRVGRDHDRPGHLVVTLLNPHKPRDRAHYESFRHFHEAFYRAVEGASVTPWAPRALDRALASPDGGAGTRHITKSRLTGENAAAGAINEYPEIGAEVVEEIVRRATDGSGEDTRVIERRVGELLAAWARIAADAEGNAVKLGYTTRAGANRKLLARGAGPEPQTAVERREALPGASLHARCGG